jgi:glycerophosphoryl diester phosphodiesterase
MLPKTLTRPSSLAPPRSPVIIGHRGASGYRPEHTLAAYELAARLGADFLEPDLVSTADGVLVARHEPEIGATTDVAAHPEFADRRRVRWIDGLPHAGWFTCDFTLAELRTLRAVEPLPAVRPANTRFDGRYPVPTFEEILALSLRLTEELGRPIGVYPETKQPSWHASLGLALEPALVAALRAAGLDHATAPVYVQSFETGNLRALAAELSVPLVQLVRGRGGPADGGCYARRCSPAGLREVAEYASAIGPHKSQILAGVLDEPTSLVADAHAAGLAVHPWTFRMEERFRPGYDSMVDELGRFLDTGVDAVFTDNPDAAVLARAVHLSGD